MKFSMRSSRVLKKLRSGQTVNCFKINLSDTRAYEIAAMHGFDCLWSCMEHIGTDWSTIEKAVLATKAYDVDLVCRIARGSYSDYVRPLELDSTGIMVPHVMSADDAADVIAKTRFYPLGRRAVDGGNADALFCNVDFNEYLKIANTERFIILQIEDPEPLAELDKIAALDGFDVLFFGAADFSVSIGQPGQLSHPEVQKARKLIVKTAHKYNKYAGATCGIGNRKDIISMGYDFICMGADVIGLNNYCKEIVATWENGSHKSSLHKMSFSL